jgi:hypothetical protein
MAPTFRWKANVYRNFRLKAEPHETDSHTSFTCSLKRSGRCTNHHRHNTVTGFGRSPRGTSTTVSPGEVGIERTVP